MQSEKWSLYSIPTHGTLSDFLESKTRSKIPLWHELNTVSVDVSENVELKDAFYLHFLVACDPN